MYKDDCVYTFDTPESAHGLDVCLTCNLAFSPDPSHDFTKFHYQETGHPRYVNLRRTPKPRATKQVKLAVSAEKEDDLYDTVTSVKDLTGADVDADTAKQAIDSVLAAKSYAERQEIQAWELDIHPCEHVLLLKQNEALPLTPEQLGKCAQCDLTSNLWLCLECGELSCGRAQFGGGGGNGHALKHYESTKHPPAVKLGSITPEGSVDVYCYACDEEVMDPEIANHLAHWGIDIARSEKTEKSMTELQLEQNVKWDFAMETATGEELEPVQGPGLTGLRNMGNTCYLNSVVQCLFSLPAFSNHFSANTPEKTSLVQVRDPPNDLIVQLAKLQDGLNSGRYARSDPHSDAGYQRGLVPAMLKHLVGRNHPEFATMGQQDAFEFWTHLITEIQRASRAQNLVDPTDIFKFSTERRLECNECHQVRYKTEPEENLSIAVPIEELEDGKYKEVQFDELLKTFTANEEVEYTCPSCSAKHATASTKFKTFPEILVVNASRFQIVNWVPRKADVPVIVPPEVALDAYLSKGPQPGENAVEEDDDVENKAAAEAAFEPNEMAFAMLVSMGFPDSDAIKALKATGNEDAQAAMDYILNPPQTGASLPAAVDEASVSQLEAMGFTAVQAQNALKKNPNVEAAIEWLFAGNAEAASVPDTQEPAAPVDPTAFGDASVPADYRLKGIISHKGSSVHVGHYVAFVRHGESWYLYNDEKVVKGAEITEMQQYAYVYVFERVHN